MQLKTKVPQVSVLIPSLLVNQHFLMRCLHSLNTMSKDTPSFEIVIIVHAAQQAFERVKNACELEHFSFHVTWIFLEKNLGFAGAINRGIQSTNAPFVAVLNDDVEVDKRWLTALIQTQKTTGADMVASTVFLSDHKTLDSQGFTFLWRGKAIALHEGSGQGSDHQLREKDYWLNCPNFFPKISKDHRQFFHEPFGPDAAACVYTRRLFNAVGLFNGTFFAYLEDVELALCARKHGFFCALAPEALAFHHKHSTSSTFGSRFKRKQDLLNWWRIILLHFDRRVWTTFGPKILIERLRNVSGFLKTIF